MERGDLQQLSKDELIELVLKLQRPDKTSRTSSKPPSLDRKERRSDSKPGGALPGHAGHWRKLAGQPDLVRDHRPLACGGCGAAFGPDAASEVDGEYDGIEIAPVRPVATRHRRLCLQCPGCGAKTAAPLPDAARGTPFGPQVHALAVYFKTLQAVSYERLERMFKDVFGLEISQGALTNMLARTGAAFKACKAEAVAVLRKARCVASDETGMRIEGVNGFQWVFSCKEAVVHEAAMTRGAAVAREMMAGHKPEVWLSDGYGGQRGHGEHHQTCLAHLAREVAFGCEAGADHVPALFKLWFGKVFDLARAAASMARPALEARRRALDAELGRLAAMATACPVAAALQTKIARARDRMLTFCAYPGEVEATNNASERHLRPSVVQRKVTNGFRAKWAADHDAAVRTTVDTARLKGAGPFQTICATIR